MKSPPPTVILIGMPGSGKSTIGRALSKVLDRPFLDLDHEIEERCGVKIPVIFEIEGEPGFRKRESQVLEEITLERGMVLATGGGAILAPQNRQWIAERGIVVYLRASVEELYRRTSRDRSRPLLASDNPRARLKELLTKRAPIYEDLADIVIDTGLASVTAVVQQLVSKLEQHQDVQ